MKAVVLSSGGVDSTTCLGIAINKLGKENVSSLSIYYGQKHDKELECARKIANYYDIKHYELDLSEIMKTQISDAHMDSTGITKRQTAATVTVHYRAPTKKCIFVTKNFSSLPPKVAL